jgi:DNA replication and repair protein RecF
LINKGVSREDELKFWDGELIRLSVFITEKREKAIVFLNKFLSDTYRLISGDKKNTLQIAYLKNLDGDLEQKLIQYRSREIACKKTLLGPHKDDLVFNLNNFNMANFASRGEIRSAVLALKISELKFLEEGKKLSNFEKFSPKPILLLDDIFSEFDPERREHLCETILQYQTLITATEKLHFSQELLKKSKVVELNR